MGMFSRWHLNRAKSEETGILFTRNGVQVLEKKTAAHSNSIFEEN